MRACLREKQMPSKPQKNTSSRRTPHSALRTPFVHLNVHSDYSKGWGVASIEDLCRRAKTLGMDRLALTDTNGMYGLVFFVQAARDAGILPIVGSEVVCGPRRAVLLIQNFQGYANLCRILSDRHCYTDFDLISAIIKHRHGLVVFSDDFTLLKAMKQAGLKICLWKCHRGIKWQGVMPSPEKPVFPPWPPTGPISLKRDSFSCTAFCGPCR